MMKLMIAIVNKDDSRAALSALTHAGFTVTKLATVGGFLMAGNTTFLVGTEEERVDEAFHIIESQCKKRIQMVPNNFYGSTAYEAYPVEVTVGGATVFVTSVDRFERL